jgi:hypothetical protein
MWLARALYALYDRRLSQHPKIELVYETMIHGNSLSEEAAQAVCELVDVPQAPMSSNLVKMNPTRLSDIVSNYDELARALVGTEFEAYLD